MFRIILIIALLYSPVTFAKDYLIAFAGVNTSIDKVVINKISKTRHLELKILGWLNYQDGLDIIKTSNKYELYGYGIGAETVGLVMKMVESQNLKRPAAIVTIGAKDYVDVDFSKYNIPFQNYFGLTGKGNVCPGIHLPDMPVYKIQRYVAEKYLN